MDYDRSMGKTAYYKMLADAYAELSPGDRMTFLMAIQALEESKRENEYEDE